MVADFHNLGEHIWISSVLIQNSAAVYIKWILAILFFLTNSPLERPETRSSLLQTYTLLSIYWTFNVKACMYQTPFINLFTVSLNAFGCNLNTSGLTFPQTSDWVRIFLCILWSYNWQTASQHYSSKMSLLITKGIGMTKPEQKMIGLSSFLLNSERKQSICFFHLLPF